VCSNCAAARLVGYSSRRHQETSSFGIRTRSRNARTCRRIEWMKAPTGRRISGMGGGVRIEPERIATARNNSEIGGYFAPLVPKRFLRQVSERGKRPPPSRKAQPRSPFLPLRSLSQDPCRSHRRAGDQQDESLRTLATVPTANHLYLPGMP
jgi:hypothetical protein